MFKLLKYLVTASVLFLPVAYGQEGPSPQAFEFDTALSGAQEVPPVETPASGSFTIHFDEAMEQARYQLEFAGTTSQATAAHLHCAAAGENGPVVVPLQLPTGVPQEQTLTNADIDATAGAAETCGLPINNLAALFAAILAEKIYVNVHTETNPPGEIRGQLFSVQLAPEADTGEQPPTF